MDSFHYSAYAFDDGDWRWLQHHLELFLPPLCDATCCDSLDLCHNRRMGIFCITQLYTAIIASERADPVVSMG